MKIGGMNLPGWARKRGNNWLWCAACLVSLWAGWLLLEGRGSAAQPLARQAPDVLFIVVDDLNDWITLLDEQAPIPTPNLQRLASRGMLFSRAYCMSPACNPSRASALTGWRPTQSGVYGNKSDWRLAMPEKDTLMQRFRKQGYEVLGAGKVFHHHLDGAFHDGPSFEGFQPMRPQSYPPSKLNQAPEYGSPNTDWGAWPPDEQDAIDSHTMEYCLKQLGRTDRDRPMFLACGLFKPHSPFFAPKAYHEGWDHLPLPVRKADDWADLPSGAARLLSSKAWFWRGMTQLETRLPGSYPDFIRSYAACVKFMDTQVGRLLDALDRNPEQRARTQIVLWSDHGFHLGEKDHIEKFALWEKSTHIPLILVAPGQIEPGTRCDRPVDLSVLFPTMLELAGLEADPSVEGASLMPLLKNPKATWNQPALMTYMPGNHAVRSDRWRFIRYADGTEELYDHSQDSMEWENLAGDPRWKEVLQEHRQWLPSEEASPVKDLRKPR